MLEQATGTPHRTETVGIYHFDQLSAEAKERARTWYRDASSQDEWWDCVYDDARTVAALMGVTITDIGFSGFCSQGDGAHFEGTFAYAKGCANAVANHAPQDFELQAIAHDWQALQSRAFYRVTGEVSHDGHYQHQYCTDFDVYVNGDEASDEVREAVKECLRNFMGWMYEQLEKDFDAQNSDEAIDENIVANEYEFTVAGEIA